MVANSNDLDFQDASRYIQEGSWKPAIKILEKMLNDSPESRSSILPLLEDVRMRSRIRTKGTQGRSSLSLLITRKRITYLLVALVLLVMGIGGRGVYNRVVAPARAQQLERSLIEGLIDQARSALSGANYAVAADLFEQALEKKPDSVEAEKGYNEAQRQIELSTSYDSALSALSRGETESALEILNAIMAKAPGYRDVEKQIDQIRTQGKLGELFVQAEAAYQDQRWAEAIPRYVEVRQSNQGYESDLVEQHLYESYVNLADFRAGVGGQSAVEVDEIAQLYRLALSLRPKDRDSRLHEQMMNQYLQAGMLMDVDRHSEAIGLLDELHKNAPGMLGGDPIQLLYNARLGYGKQLEQGGSYYSALAQYAAAQDLPVADVSEARLRALTVSLALTPTPTPTPEPTPTPTPDPFQDFLAGLPPQPSPLEDFPGWIVFQSDRPYGSRDGLWVMSPDGSQQLPVNDPDGRYDFLKKQALWTNDNMRRIWVEDDGSGKSVAIYMWRYDIPINWLDARVELLNNSGINYQPALSPDNNAIVFTSQRNDGPLGTNYGDEIFVIYFSEYNSSGYVTAHRLTKNDWEWDKHPTFSPDSRSIAFWSNRETGRAQIWTMNADGSNQRNLSNNEWNDWDPVYIVPFREIPKLEKDGQLAPLFDPSKYTGNK
jgi:tetratricopeptide (TPR) repeat protein